ncbi:SDR family oxidoreductase [Clostridium sp. C2-6-12]|uniref:SDR family oxidoreductase n=1 Tax=Clostridium sp. C2-6-12 TaxID=2698832 RepID=UPI00136A374D|nr:SDR family oxidoreductase [Clostridium sp. C2-6-12]
MKILVTGGAGFIGSNTVDMLIDNDFEVCVIDNLSHGKKENINSKAKFYKADIRDEAIFEILKNEKPDIVIHNAAQISVPNSINDPIEDASINIMGTINIIEAARTCGVKKIIYPASAAIFGEPQYLPVDEKHPLNMISPYGITKHTVEHYLYVYKQLYNIDYTVLRYSNVYGPRQDSSGEGGVVSIFCEKLLRNEAPNIYGDGEQIRDFVYVKDVAKANLIAIKSNGSEIYNVCTNSRTTVNSLFYCIAEILGKNIKPIYALEREGDIKNSYMSYDKIQEELGWKPEYSLENGIEETLNYYNQLL